MDKGPLPQPGESLSFLILLGVRKGACHQLHRYVLRAQATEHALLRLLHHTPTQVNKHFWDVNLDGTHIIAGSTEGGSIGQGTGLLYTKQLRRQDGPDRAVIDRGIGVPTSALIDWTDIQASTTADAIESLATDGIGEHLCASIVQQHEMELLGAITLVHTGP